MTKHINRIFNSFSMKLFCMLCIYILSILVLYSITSILNINNILGIIQLLSLIVSIYYILKVETKKQAIISIIIFVFLTIITPFIYNNTYDLTIDGNNYHKTAIAFIKNGYNPIYNNILDFQKDNPNIVKIEETSKVDIWVEHYPKATWIFAATMYNMTGNIESGKCITLILVIMCFIITFNCLLKVLNKTWSIIFSLLLTLNPIILVQFFSYYVDGLMGICFLIELLLLFNVNPLEEKQDKNLWISIISIATLFTNLKFTGLMCSGVIAALFYFYWIIKYRKENNFFKHFKQITLLFVITYLTAIFIVGSNSYIKNLIDHKNPLYPLIGSEKIDIITLMQPSEYNNMNMLEKFFYSIFSKTENTTYLMGKPTLKLPYLIYETEENELKIPDTRSGGFGPYFAFTLLLSIVVFIPSILLFIKNERKNIHYLLIFIGSIIITVIIIGENWWARYIPQFYFLIVGNIALGIYVSKYLNHIILYKLFSSIPIITLLVNLSYLFTSFNYQIECFEEVNKDLEYMKNKENLRLKTTNKDAYGYLYNLNDLNIKYTYIENINEENIKFRYSWRIQEEIK